MELYHQEIEQLQTMIQHKTEREKIAAKKIKKLKLKKKMLKNTTKLYHKGSWRIETE